MRCRIVITGCVALATGVAAFPADARANFCRQYNISSNDDPARLYQSNGSRVDFEFGQSRSRLAGRASHFSGSQVTARGIFEPIFRGRGTVAGTVYPSARSTGIAIVSFKITWDAGPIGAYIGTLRNGLTVNAKMTGYLTNGRTWDLRHPQSRATWDLGRIGKDATCVEEHPR